MLKKGGEEIYRYDIKLYPEAVKKRDGLDLSCTIGALREIAGMFNTVSSKVDNKKFIEVESLCIVGDTIMLSLYSVKWLEFPTRALRFFISKVAKLTEYIPLITDNGRLFKGESIYIAEEQENNMVQEIKHLTDEELMIEMVKIFNRKTSENRMIIDKIKKILEER